MKNHPELSIIIVNWNNASFLKECIDSIIENRGDIDYEIIVVDNASSDGSAEMVQAEFRHLNNLILIANERNENYARGNNSGYERASGRFICLLNPDIVVQPGMFQAMMAHLDANPAVGLVGAKIQFPDGSLQRINRRFPTWYYVFFTYKLIGKVIDRFLLGRTFQKRYFYLDETYQQVTDIEQVATSCAMLHRRTIDQLGSLFDEQFPLFFNDVDLCKRLHNAGYLVQVILQAEVIHHGGQGTKLLSERDYFEALFTGMLRYFRKHDPKGVQLLFLFWPRLRGY